MHPVLICIRILVLLLSAARIWTIFFFYAWGPFWQPFHHLKVQRALCPNRQLGIRESSTDKSPHMAFRFYPCFPYKHWASRNWLLGGRAKEGQLYGERGSHRKKDRWGCMDTCIGNLLRLPIFLNEKKWWKQCCAASSNFEAYLYLITLQIPKDGTCIVTARCSESNWRYEWKRWVKNRETVFTSHTLYLNQPITI